MIDKKHRNFWNAMKSRSAGKGGTAMPADSSGNREFTIQDLARRLNVSEKTLKKWERERKIPEARRSKFGWRLYTERELDAVETLVKANGFFVKANGNPTTDSRSLKQA